MQASRELKMCWHLFFMADVCNGHQAPVECILLGRQTWQRASQGAGKRLITELGRRGHWAKDVAGSCLDVLA